MTKEAMDLKETWEGHVGGFGERGREGRNVTFKLQSQ